VGHPSLRPAHGGFDEVVAIVNLEKQGDSRELYDRRVNVYHTVREFLAQFARDVKVDLQTILQLYRDTREAEFLSGEKSPSLQNGLPNWHSSIVHLHFNQAGAVGDMREPARDDELETCY
jgi:hypothetical protein